MAKNQWRSWTECLLRYQACFELIKRIVDISCATLLEPQEALCIYKMATGYARVGLAR